MDAEFTEGFSVPDVEAFRVTLLACGLRADLFAFSSPLEKAECAYPLPHLMDNAAVVETANFGAWWDALPQEARKNARRAGKRGVVLRVADFDDEFVVGIKKIYDETPIRQGRRFWHFGKPAERVRSENATYLDKSEFIGAYLNGELIGFLKLVYVGQVGRIMQILALNAHHDKRPMNALVVKAVERCAAKGMEYLVYGRYTYGNKLDSSIAEFKRRMGFRQLDFPRYFLPLTIKGRLAVRMGLQRELIEVLPSQVIAALSSIRSAWLVWRYRHPPSAVPGSK
jgi:hypothetical protein